MRSLAQIVEPWMSEWDADDLFTLKSHVLWLERLLYADYEPHQAEDFEDRLVCWLENLPDGEDRKTLFRLLAHLLFVSKHQFDALFRAAYDGDIARWLIGEAGLRLDDPALQDGIGQAVQATWFCPLTDSMRINSFLKVNGLTGHGYCPDWRSLELLADPARIREFIVTAGIARLVLLEDFVGSGEQVMRTADWAAEVLPATSILLVPLICCPDGATAGRRIEARRGNLAFAPTLTLRPELFLHGTAQPNEPSAFGELRGLVDRVRHRLGKFEKSPLGFGDTGALVALFSNCPDNSLPMIHHATAEWVPLFRRVSRS